MIAREKPLPSDPDGNGPQSNSSDPDHEADSTSGFDGAPSPLEPLLRHIAELQMLVRHYVRARADQILARARTIAFLAAAGVLGVFVGVAFVVTAVVLALRGIAGGLMSLGLQPWAADLITGLACIAAIASFLAIGFFVQRSVFRRKTRNDYEHYRARYRAKFGDGLDKAGREK